MQAIAVEALTKTYHNGIQALKRVDLAIEQGDFFALLGPNGAGKSTLISILCTLIKKTQGEVSIAGFDLNAAPAQAKFKLGVMPQEINLPYFETCLDILVQQSACYGISQKRARPRCEALLVQVGLGDKLQTKAGHLSGGMKRRLMIARALVHDPEILILDEPTAGVDIAIRHALWDLLADLNQQGKTIVLTTHYLEEAERLCRHIAIIDRGEIIVQAPMQQLLKQVRKESLQLVLEQPLQQAPVIDDLVCRLIEPDLLEVCFASKHNVTSVCQALSEQDIIIKQVLHSEGRLERLFKQLTMRQEVEDAI